MGYFVKVKKYEQLVARSVFEAALRGGEDYELMFTVTPKNWDKLVEKYIFSTKLTVIGKMTSKKEFLQIENNKAIPLVKGFDHLSENINL